jgi:heme-degrading monooxygenase HmoA
MKNVFALLSLAMIGSFSVTGFSAALPPAPVFELRVYSVHEGKLPELLARFREHTCKLFEKHGMVNVGYWTPLDAKDGYKLFYVLQHRTLEAARESWKAFRADPEWQAVQKASEANGRIVDSVSSTFMALADYSKPPHTLSGGPHVFELRTYTTNEGKLDALDKRFREHTDEIFQRHGLSSFEYWHPLDANQGAGHTLIYILVHDSREAATKNWAAFQADPEWIKVRNASEENGKLLVHTPASVFLAPTDFSALK